MADLKLSDVISKFNGDGDITLWYDKLELVIALKGIADEAKFVPLLLEGPAFDVYQHLSDDNKKKKDEVKAALLSTFGMSPFKAYSTFKSRSLNFGESPDVYLSVNLIFNT